MLHQVCNQHEWTGGKCNHLELEEHDLPWFDRRDKDFEALQKVILEPQLLDSFKYYVRFRSKNRIWLVMIIFPKKLLVIETTFLPINETLAQRQPLYQIIGPQDVGAHLL